MRFLHNSMVGKVVKETTHRQNSKQGAYSMNKFYRVDHEQAPETVATIEKDGTVTATFKNPKTRLKETFKGVVIGKTKKFMAVDFGTFTHIYAL